MQENCGGCNQWAAQRCPVHRYLSQQRGASPDKATDEAIEMYQKGLQAARVRKEHCARSANPLICGEPECLMSLAASNLYKTTPKLAAAEQYARAALALVPYWHYMSDILVPSIETAKKKQQVTIR